MEYVDSRIDLNGEILIAKEADSMRTTPIDLQWMVITCDPESVERETCHELPVYQLRLNVFLCPLFLTFVDTLHAQPREAPQAPQCTMTCPAGPPGQNGTRVSGTQKPSSPYF